MCNKVAEPFFLNLNGVARAIGLCGGLFLCLFLLSSCGDIGVALPRNGSYQMRALVNNVSLDENSLVWAGDKIRPYCDTLLSKDPDVSGLLVLVQNAQGETVGGRIHYTLRNPDDSDYTLPEENPEQEEETDLEAEDENNIEEEIEYVAVIEEEYIEAEEPEETLADDESVGEDEDSENPPPALAAEEIEDTIFWVRSLDVQLPTFTLPEGLEVGLYTLVFRVMGDRETFSETEQSFFYLGNSRFSLKDLNLYLPGVYADAQLIRPGTKVLLEAVIETERSINPYIVWYNGKKIIEEGFASDGMGTIFFEAPEQTSFQTLRAEIFPTRARQGMSGISREIVLPVSAKADEPEFFSGTALADFVDMIAETGKYAADFEAANIEIETDEGSSQRAEVPGSELMHWYQFAGTLDDANDFPNGANKLVSISDRQPRFSPLDFTYGLTTGPFESYALPGISFVQEAEENGGGAFLFRIKSFSNGGILNVVFDTPPARQVSMHLLAEDGNIVLRLIAGEDVKSEMAIPAKKGEGEKAVPVTAAVVFYLLPDRLEAKLVPDGKLPNEVEPIYVRLREPLGGKCRVSLGNQAVSVREQRQSRGGEQVRGRNNSRRNLPISTIWNELAVFYLDTPEFDLLEPLEPEIVEEVIAPVASPSAAVPTMAAPVAEPTVGAPAVHPAPETQAADAETKETVVDEVEPKIEESAEKDMPLDVSNEPENV